MSVITDKLLEIQQALVKGSHSIVSPLLLERKFSLKAYKAKRVLTLGVKRGVFQRAKRGLYLTLSIPPTTFELANVLYTPSYISLETALSYYRIIPEVTYATTSISLKPTNEFECMGRLFSYSTIKKTLFFGYSKKNIGGKEILVADKEKALLDYLYFTAIGHKKVNDRFNFQGIDYDKINGYLPLFRSSLRGRKLTTFNNLLTKYL